MKIFHLLSSVLLAGVLLAPTVAFAQREIPPHSLLAAANPAIVLSQAQGSVFRVGVRLYSTLVMPEPNFDPETISFYPRESSTQDEVTTYRLGTAFVVNEEGYLLTNAHVVDTSMNSILDDLWEMYQYNAATILEDAVFDQCRECSQEDVDAYISAYLDYVSKYGEWGDSTTYDVIIFDPREEGTIDELYENGFKADIKKLGEPYPLVGKDVAVLKIEKSVLPLKALPIGSSDRTSAGDTIYVVGYPTIADLSEKAFLVPTITAGIVSAIKPSDLGDYKVIQIDAGIKGGNSGGPALNDRGEVVGIATFAATDADSYNWILPIELGTEFLREINISTETKALPSLTYILSSIPLWAWGLVVLLLILLTGMGVYFHMHRKMKALQGAHAYEVPGTGVRFDHTPPPFNEI